MRENKVQTGLRVPEGRYTELANMADSIGVSLNTLALMLIDIGLSAINRGTQEEHRALLHNLQDIS